MKTAGLGAPVQIAYAVPDARVAAQEWIERFGAGPFFVRPHIPVVDVVYRGQPSTFDHTSAYGQWGSLMVELVQDHGTAPSVVRERCAPHESGTVDKQNETPVTAQCDDLSVVDASSKHKTPRLAHVREEKIGLTPATRRGAAS